MDVKKRKEEKEIERSFITRRLGLERIKIQRRILNTCRNLILSSED
jgi:hypothetical protein